MPRSRLLRFLIGLALLLVIVIPGFAIADALIPTFGAAPAELNQTLPGDELLPTPIIFWQHAITINARPEQVWPWIIQIGDTRAGFYSYMFIERRFPGSASLYNNASSIHPEWQTPTKGQGIIADLVVIRDYQPYQYLLAMGTEKLGGLGWTWLWRITPTADGRTRLLIHMRIQAPPGAGSSALVKTFMNLGGFIMERNMMTGLQTRAEGGAELSFTEPLEIALWLAALATGFAGAVRFITRPAWALSLAIGLAAVLSLFVLTFLQPALWLRALIDLALAAALVVEFRN